MKNALIDSNDLFITTSDEETGIPVPDPLKSWYQPKWTGTEWIEGMSKTKRDALQEQSLLEQSKAGIAKKINDLTVTVDGLIFDANETSQIRMLSAIQAAQVTGQDSTVWRLSDNTEQTITLAQLKEAQALAIQATGALIMGSSA